MSRQQIKIPLYACATAIGVDRQTITRNCVKLGIEAKEGLTPRELVRIATGDRQQVKARKDELELAALEREERKAAGELVDGAKFEQEIKEDLIIPFKQKLIESARKHGWEKHLNKVLDEVRQEFDLKGFLK